MYHSRTLYIRDFVQCISNPSDPSIRNDLISYKSYYRKLYFQQQVRDMLRDKGRCGHENRFVHQQWDGNQRIALRPLQSAAAVGEAACPLKSGRVKVNGSRVPGEAEAKTEYLQSYFLSPLERNGSNPPDPARRSARSPSPHPYPNHEADVQESPPYLGITRDPLLSGAEPALEKKESCTGVRASPTPQATTTGDVGRESKGLPSAHGHVGR